MLTKQILQDAADLIGPPSDGEPYMCHAVHAASGGSFAFNAPSSVHNPVVRSFMDLLYAQGVDARGSLRNDFGVNTGGLTDTELCALRFDFLNLLAESIA